MTEQESKTCTVCGETKPLDQFHKKARATDGRRSQCKECSCAATKDWRSKNPERAKASIEKWRRENPERQKETSRERNRRFRERHPEREVERGRRRRAEDSETQQEYLRRHRERHPEKAAARAAVQRAVQNGELAKPDTCEDCGEWIEDSRRIHGHHEDYSRPLKVAWLCKPCHDARHRTY